jgi:hypothetical protein
VAIRSRYVLSMAMGLCLAQSLPAQQPDALALDRTPAAASQEISPNQQTANNIAENLRQREEALRIVQGVPGVERVLNRLATGSAITQVQAPAQPAPVQAAPPQNPGFPPEPRPVYQAPTPSPYDLNPPNMPPYAWPTYAPYNNYSRVAYPEAYPYSAWPFIGPVYPFPKVPLGWRSVKLEWEDGHWWFRKTATGHDWWHLRYW